MLLVFLVITLTLTFVLIINTFPINNVGLSACFVCTYLFNVYTIWNTSGKKINLFFLFYLSFGLFIGGSLFAVLFGYDEDPFMPTFFYNYNVSYERRVTILEYVFSFMSLSTLGYILGYHTNLNQDSTFNLSSTSKEYLKTCLKFIFPILILLMIGDSIKSFLSVINEGYLALYISVQNDSYSGSSFLTTFLLIFFGLAMAYGDKKIKSKYIILFVIQSLFSIIMGRRSGFGALLLVLLWIYSMYYRISLKKIFILCLSSVFILLLIYSFSIRAIEQGPTDNSILDKLLFFLHSQGSSLMVFDTSRLINDYPALPYFQSIFPGSSTFYSLFSGKELFHQDISFSGHLCYNLNPELYLSGCGLGWSLLSDLYLFSGKQWLFFLILCFLFGFTIAILERKSQAFDFYKFLSFSFVFNLVLLPRGGLSSIFPLLIYSVLLWCIFLIFFQFFRRKLYIIDLK